MNVDLVSVVRQVGREFDVATSWDAARSDNVELDIWALLLTSSNIVPGDEYFVFFNQRRSPCGSVVHAEDTEAITGFTNAGNLKVEVTSISNEVDRILFGISVYDFETKNQTFSNLNNAFVNIKDKTEGIDLLRLDLSGDYSSESVLVIGELVRSSRHWDWRMILDHSSQSFAGLVRSYGVRVSEE